MNEDGSLQQAQTSRAGRSATDLRRALVIGFGAVSAGSVIALGWILFLIAVGAMAILDDGSMSGPRRLVHSLLLLALPCAAIASILAWLGLRWSVGLHLAARMTTIALWTALTPILWGLGSYPVAALFAPDSWSAGYLLMGATSGMLLWGVSGVPLFVALIVRAFVREDPTTAPKPPRGPAFHGRDEFEEDAEVSRRPVGQVRGSAGPAEEA